jgi:redox-sensitive bicupin YhaK (pirin superfamily)
MGRNGDGLLRPFCIPGGASGKWAPPAARYGEAMSTPRKVLGVDPAPALHWVGDGFAVHTMFSYAEHGEDVSPFLLLDYAAPREFPPDGSRRGVGEHPHRGFETVTVALQGEIEHRDSAGHRGRIGPGDVQWMSAASGVVHEEFHGREFSRRGGTLEMVQLWVNLPARLKMGAPRYQDIVAKDIPVVPLPDDAGSLRIIAGEFRGVRGPARTYTPVGLWDLSLGGGKHVELDVPPGHTALLLVLRGAVQAEGARLAEAGELIRFGREGDRLSLQAIHEVRAMVLSGEPLGEPIAGYGPFVMNAPGEIRRAILDFQEGRLGRLAPEAP